MEQQRKCPDCDGSLIDGDFIIKYDVNRATSLGDIQVSSKQTVTSVTFKSQMMIQLYPIFIHLYFSCFFRFTLCSIITFTPCHLCSLQIVNGYFVHFFAPPDLPRVPKNVVFVIDRSGSMSGIKIKQVKDLVRREYPYCAIIVYQHL